jgi:hypothetical protein
MPVGAADKILRKTCMQISSEQSKIVPSTDTCPSSSKELLLFKRKEINPKQPDY